MTADNDQHSPGAGLSPTAVLAPLLLDGPSATTDESPPALKTARYGFKAGDIGFMLALRERAEVIDHSRPCPIPHTPAWFRGMINVRGQLVPVFDLLRLFDASSHYAPYKLLTIGRGAKTVALPIESLPEIIQLTTPSDETAHLPSGLTGACSRGLFLSGRHLGRCGFRRLLPCPWGPPADMKMKP